MPEEPVTSCGPTVPIFTFRPMPTGVIFCAVCYPKHARPKKTCPSAILCTVGGESGGRCEEHRDVPDREPWDFVGEGIEESWAEEE